MNDWSDDRSDDSVSMLEALITTDLISFSGDSCMKPSFLSFNISWMRKFSGANNYREKSIVLGCLSWAVVLSQIHAFSYSLSSIFC